MDLESIKLYEGEKVKITLSNNFWYRAKILSVTSQAIKFISEDGKYITVMPEAITVIIPLG